MIYCPLLQLLILAYSTTHALAQDTPQPFKVKTSDRHYGPDGPWQAVQVDVGSNSQAVDLYPGGVYETRIFTNEVCAGVSGPCGSGGLFDPNASTTLDNSSITWGKVVNSPSLDYTSGAMRYEGSAAHVTDDIKLLAEQGTVTGSKTVQNLSIILITKATTTYPDGTKYPLQVGQLSLGAPSANQTFSTGSNSPGFNTSLVPGYLWSHNVIPSSSYGLHVGAAALNLPLSLWLGGYDKSRVLGTVASQPCENSDLVIDLSDIGIGVDHGASPFSYSARQGILHDGNSSIPTSLRMSIVPAAPYMYLPKSTCDSIAKDLPVTFNSKYGLYFWNTQDPLYRQIVTSPSYLSFTFKAGGGGNMTVKVPFQLLNLTLDQPLISTPTPYFPCQPPQGQTGDPAYSLGRAFLQAATIGVNWNQVTGQWFLAQAPGPNTVSSPQQVNFGDTIQTSSTAWADTWSGVWKAIDLPGSPTSTNATNSSGTQTISSAAQSSTHPSNNGLSTGGKAGIGASIACAAVFAGLLGIYFYRRHRKGQASASSSQHEGLMNLKPLSKEQQVPMTERSLTGPIYEVDGHNPVEIYTDGPAAELDNGHAR